MTEHSTVASYLGELRRTLEPAPRKRRDRLLTEAGEHLRDLVAEKTAQGVEPADAERAALRRFGDVHEVGHHLLLTALVSDRGWHLHRVLTVNAFAGVLLAAWGVYYAMQRPGIVGHAFAAGMVGFGFALVVYYTYAVLSARGNEPTVDTLERKIQGELMITRSIRWQAVAIGSLSLIWMSLTVITAIGRFLANPATEVTLEGVAAGVILVGVWVAVMTAFVLFFYRYGQRSVRRIEERATRWRELVSSSN